MKTAPSPHASRWAPAHRCDVVVAGGSISGPRPLFRQVDLLDLPGMSQGRTAFLEAVQAP